MTLDSRNGRAECGIGSGITWESSVAEEYAEWLVKRRFLLRADAGFELIETLRLADGKYDLLERHIARLQASAEYFGFALNVVAVLQATNAMLANHATGVWRARLTVDCHGGVKTECTALDPNADAAVNYGAIGGVIGHEMGHGFDDQGSKSDARGVLRTWWAPTDEEAFKKLVDRLALQYDGYMALPGLNVNGRLDDPGDGALRPDVGTGNASTGNASTGNASTGGEPGEGLTLHFIDVTAKRRLCQLQRTRRPREIALAQHSQEGPAQFPVQSIGAHTNLYSRSTAFGNLF